MYPPVMLAPHSHVLKETDGFVLTYHKNHYFGPEKLVLRRACDDKELAAATKGTGCCSCSSYSTFDREWQDMDGRSLMQTEVDKGGCFSRSRSVKLYFPPCELIGRVTRKKTKWFKRPEVSITDADGRRIAKMRRRSDFMLVPQCIVTGMNDQALATVQQLPGSLTIHFVPGCSQELKALILTAAPICLQLRVDYVNYAAVCATFAAAVVAAEVVVPRVQVIQAGKREGDAGMSHPSVPDVVVIQQMPSAIVSPAVSPCSGSEGAAACSPPSPQLEVILVPEKH